MDPFHELANLIQQNCPEIVKNFWEPVKAEESELSDCKYVTKFGGSNPFRGNNFRWPMCEEKDCGKPKSFICQIELDKIPDERIRNLLKDFGLFQCFWCTSPECLHENWREENHFRLIPRSEMIPSLKTLSAFRVYESKADTSVLPSGLQKFVKKLNEQFEDLPENESDSEAELFVGKEVQVKTWVESDVKEIPMPEEIMNNDNISKTVLAVPGITKDLLTKVKDMHFRDSVGDEARPIATPRFGVKIGGYVRWFTHGYVGYSTCKDCHVEMDIPFLQLDYQDDLQEYNWVPDNDIRDSATANILLCPGCGKPKIWVRSNP